jgi:hypothetical protein
MPFGRPMSVGRRSHVGVGGSSPSFWLWFDTGSYFAMVPDQR